MRIRGFSAHFPKRGEGVVWEGGAPDPLSQFAKENHAMPLVNPNTTVKKNLRLTSPTYALLTTTSEVYQFKNVRRRGQTYVWGFTIFTIKMF
jgi:hypothetical protein